MRYLFIFVFSVLFNISQAQEITSTKFVVTSNNLSDLVKTETEIPIDQFIYIIKFEKGDTIFTPASLLKLNQILFSYPNYGIRVIGLNNTAAYYIERRWKAIRNYILKTGGSGISVEIWASGSLKSFTYKPRMISLVIFGD